MAKEGPNENARMEFSWTKLDTCLQFKVTKQLCADYMECSIDTIENRIREKYDMTFTEYKDIKMSKTKMLLQETAVNKALGGNITMLIFCLKNLCNWADKQEISAGEKTSITLNYSLDDKKEGK